VFAEPTVQLRIWQMGFSEFTTARGGIWRICAVIDYATKCSPRSCEHAEESLQRWRIPTEQDQTLPTS
jgi:hypothetical protein